MAKSMVEVDAGLLTEAQRAAGVETADEAVRLALEELIERRRPGILRLRGKVRWEGDLDEARSD